MKERMQRVTVTLHPADVALLDRLAALEGSTRSAELQGILAQLRPMVRHTVEAFEAALRARDAFDRAAAQSEIEGLVALLPEVDKLQDAYMGALSRLEGAAAVAEVERAEDPRPSRHGGHTPTPPEN